MHVKAVKLRSATELFLWKTRNEHTATRFVISYSNASTVLFHNAPYKCQPQTTATKLTAAGFIHTKKRLKDFFFAIIGNPNAGIRNLDRHTFPWLNADTLLEEVQAYFASIARLCAAAEEQKWVTASCV